MNRLVRSSFSASAMRTRTAATTTCITLRISSSSSSRSSPPAHTFLHTPITTAPPPPQHRHARYFSRGIAQRQQDTDEDRTDKEKTIHKILTDELKPVALHVADVSGGCGSMFNVYVSSEEFVGMTLVKQHRRVYDLLRQEIPAMHGLSLQTKTPEEYKDDMRQQAKKEKQ